MEEEDINSMEYYKSEAFLAVRAYTREQALLKELQTVRENKVKHMVNMRRFETEKGATVRTELLEMLQKRCEEREEMGFYEAFKKGFEEMK